jgi:hypothetical protein
VSIYKGEIFFRGFCGSGGGASVVVGTDSSSAIGGISKIYRTVRSKVERVPARAHALHLDRHARCLYIKVKYFTCFFLVQAGKLLKRIVAYHTRA